MLRISDRVHVASDSESVWNFVWAAENVSLTQEKVLRVYHEEGSPLGAVGERQRADYQVRDNVLTNLTEVVELDPGRRAVTVQIEPPDGSRATTEVVPDPDGGCWLSFEFAYEQVCQACPFAESLALIRGELKAILAAYKANIEGTASEPETATEGDWTSPSVPKSSYDGNEFGQMRPERLPLPTRGIAGWNGRRRTRVDLAAFRRADAFATRGDYGLALKIGRRLQHSPWPVMRYLWAHWMLEAGHSREALEVLVEIEEPSPAWQAYLDSHVAYILLTQDLLDEGQCRPKTLSNANERIDNVLRLADGGVVPADFTSDDWRAATLDLKALAALLGEDLHEASRLLEESQQQLQHPTEATVLALVRGVNVTQATAALDDLPNTRLKSWLLNQLTELSGSEP